MCSKDSAMLRSHEAGEFSLPADGTGLIPPLKPENSMIFAILFRTESGKGRDFAAR